MLFNIRNRFFKLFSPEDAGGVNNALVSISTSNSLEEIDRLMSEAAKSEPVNNNVPENNGNKTEDNPGNSDNGVQNNENNQNPQDDPNKVSVQNNETPKPEDASSSKIEGNTAQLGTNLVLSEEVLTKIINEKLQDKPEEERSRILKKLEPFKGKTLEEIALGLGHSQLHIDKLNAQRSKETKEQFFKKPELTTKEQSNIAQTPATIVPESQEAKDKLILARVKDRIPEGIAPPPNFDVDSPEFEEWFNEFNYSHGIKAQRFLKSLETESKAVNDLWQQAKYFEDNYDKVLSDQQNEAVTGISNYFKENLNIDLKDYGYNFSPNENGDIALIDSLVFSNGEINKDLVEYVFGRTPLLKPNQIVVEFVRNELPKILMEKEKRVAEQARRDAIAATNKPKQPVEPSMGNKTPQKKEISVNDIGSASTREELDELLKKI